MEGLIRGLQALAPADKRDTAAGMAKEVLEGLQDTAGGLTIGNLRKVVAEEVKTALTEAKKAQPTWASVTSAVALIASDPGVPKKVVPPRLSR